MMIANLVFTVTIHLQASMFRLDVWQVVQPILDVTVIVWRKARAPGLRLVRRT
jgi:hypothetical protein